MEPGDRCVCIEKDWYNAFGEKHLAIQIGMRLTVLDTRRIGGISFYSFEETPKNFFYMFTGLCPMRELN